MTRESLLAIQFKVSVLYVIDYYAVIQALSGKIFTVWVQCSWRHCLHIWLADVFSNYRNSELPDINFLVIRRRNKLLSILDKSKTVYGSLMLFILLNNFLCICVVLKNLFILTTCKENVLLVVRRMELHTKWRSSICEATNHFPGLSVPQLNNSIIASWKKSSSVVGETNVSYSLWMSHVCSDTFPMRHYIPNLASTIVTCTKH